MNAVRTAAARGLILTAALLLAAPTAPAQPAAFQSIPAPLQTSQKQALQDQTAQSVLAQAASPSTPQRAAPAPLSAAETAALRALYQKLRPATLRIEDCPPNDCSDPNGVGSAFLIGDGYALTAYHVVKGARTLSAQTLDRKRYAVQIVGFDDQSDVALIRVNVPANTPFFPLAAARPAVGDAALAIGNGGGEFLTLKTGRLTGLDSDAGRADFPPGTLELNAQLVPGDSGGPVINARGEAIGVVSYISVSRGNRITSYAVPVTRTDPRLAELRRGVKREAPIIGITLNLPPELSPVTALPAENFAEFSRVFDLGTTPGAFFTDVSPGSPAARAGLQPLDYDADGNRTSGDIVTAVNGQRVTNFSDFQYAVRRYQPGQTITLSVLRADKPIEVKLTLVARSTVRVRN
ncbi:S1C family serine protease [Deinococcus budaensis]|uniref:S1-C subfamily serine protease n=1 Tax=Deinococcus budaensis TaxID=1665626 RepID=A0A7W8LQE7_9DEIO|nr:S1C family serine protease [Deinococcus budaensis]MBB5234530.1 S1-C subfamily serine protease [Deinococcus budaensis]